MSQFWETLFRLLFKYRPVVFERGHLAFGSSWPVTMVAGLLLLAAGLAVLAYLRAGGRTAPRDRWLLGTLRLLALGLLLFCLARPMLVLATVVPQQNYLGVLIDDSRSMAIADQNGASRGATAAELLKPDGPLVKALSSRFKLRFFRFSDVTERINGAAGLADAGRHTDLGQALDEARRELAAVPLAGLVVFTDGATNAGSMADALPRLQAAKVPVHVVGLGQERFGKDIELTRADVPRTVLKGATVAAELAIAQTGYGGETVTVDIEDGGKILASRDVRLPREGETAAIRVYFTATDAGPRRITFRVRPQPGELIADNNARQALVTVEDRRQSILYFEGEPRWEVKFLRRAVEGDSSLRLVTLLRTAKDKFLRLNVQDSTELAAGFPRTRAELFRYRGLVLGDVEASFFTHDQLRMIADFVSQRGGGLLVLGGRDALAEGGYAGSPVADALPVVLHQPRTGDSTGFFTQLKVELTPFGRAQPMLQLKPDPAASDERWNTLPELSAVNEITEVKPGASTLLTGRPDHGGTPQVVLAYQRYGSGRAAVFAVQDSWVWQMDPGIPLDDRTHETLWRQMLRWLVSDVRDRVQVASGEERVEPGQPVQLTATVSDSGYLAMNGARVTATITAPSGTVRTAPMEWTVAKDGEYRAAFTPAEAGLYTVHVEGQTGGKGLGSGTTYVDAGDLKAESFGAEMQRDLLERVAGETGGRFYTPGDVSTLPEDVSFTESGATVREERSLWDMPIVFVLLIALLGGEWVYRRRRGLP